jgi:Ala-tRNA(Pro) deacylase
MALDRFVDIYNYLQGHQIDYVRHDHEAVFTCDDAKRLRIDVNGVETKNLFLRDRDGRRHFLVVVQSEKQVDLKTLSEMLEARKLGFASAERLARYLGVTPGSVSLLALANDIERSVEVVLDKEVFEADTVLCHPLINTSTLEISNAGVRKFLSAVGHSYRVLEL